MAAAVIGALELLSVAILADRCETAAEGDVGGLHEGLTLAGVALRVSRKGVERGGVVDDEPAIGFIIGQTVDFGLPLSIEGLVTRRVIGDARNRRTRKTGVVVPSLKDVARARGIGEGHDLVVPVGAGVGSRVGAAVQHIGDAVGDRRHV